MSNPYDVLGIGRTSTVDQAQQAYRKLAMKYHPDRNQGNIAFAEAKFKEIKAAWELIEGGWTPEPEPIKPAQPQWKAAEPAKPKQPIYRPQPKPYVPPGIVAYRLSNGQGDQLGHYACSVSIAQAFAGFQLELPLGNDKHRFQIKGGIPPGKIMRLEIPGTTIEVPYRNTPRTAADFTGKQHPINPSFGSSMSVNVETVVIPNAGYSQWSQELGRSIGRGDLIVNLIPQDRQVFF
jgi:hypothetical protein